MAKLAEELKSVWHSRLFKDCPKQNPENQQSIVRWLLEEDLERFDRLMPSELVIANQAMDYRFRILRQRYLGVEPAPAYRHLITRLGSLVMLRYQTLTRVTLSPSCQRTVADMLQGAIQEMLNSDRYIQKQITWIAQCTQDTCLRDALLLTSLEEYCLRPIRNQPLLVYHFVNFLRRQAFLDMTQVLQGNILPLISEEVNLNGADSRGVADYQGAQNWEKQQGQRVAVQQEFERYLAENVDGLAVRWLRLYLQGRSQEAIASILNLPVKQVYGLRKQVSYHAIRVFPLKKKLKLVANWLETSLS
ncbi:MAG: HetZ-related protein 2 [Xenococcaceae cyanobacterium]